MGLIVGPKLGANVGFAVGFGVGLVVGLFVGLAVAAPATCSKSIATITMTRVNLNCILTKEQNRNSLLLVQYISSPKTKTELQRDPTDFRWCTGKSKILGNLGIFGGSVVCSS